MSWVAVGVTAVSAIGTAVEGSKGAKNSTTGQSGFDPNIQAGTNQAISTAENVANTPWQGMATNQAVAGLSANQLAVQQSALGGGEYLPQEQATAGLAFNNTNLQPYMNPYESQVLDTQKALMTRDYAQQKAQLQSQQAMTGAFGGDRSAIAQSQLDQNYNLNLQAMQAQGLANAYNAGTSAFSADRGYAAGQVAQNQGALASTGATAQQTQQNANTFNYNQFLEQRDWAKNQNQYLTSTLAAVPKGSYYSGSSQQQPATGGYAGALAGVGQIALAGLGQNNGISGAQGLRENNNMGSSYGAFNSGAYSPSGGSLGTVDTSTFANPSLSGLGNTGSVNLG